MMDGVAILRAITLMNLRRNQGWQQNSYFVYSAYSILIIEGMSSARGKNLRSNRSSVDLLHSGVRRTVAREDYTKIFTKIRIGQPKRHSFLPSSRADPQSELEAINAHLRQAIKDLEADNAHLSANVSKEHKLEELLDKRIGVKDLSKLTLEKAMEIKLMLEADCLQEQLREWEKALEGVAIDYRQRQIRSRNVLEAEPVELHAILCEDAREVAQLKKEKDDVILRQQEKIALIQEKTLRFREVRRGKAEELKQVQRLLGKAKDSLPNVSKISDQNQSGIYGTQIRAKTTEVLQFQIQRLQGQSINYQSKIQSLIEQKVRQKIGVLKTINQFQNLLISSAQQH